MALPTFANQYCGIPYARGGRTRSGCDCWGLCRLVYDEQFGLTLSDVADETAALRAGEWQQVEKPKQGDLLLFKTGTYKRHVAIALDHLWMLHIDKAMQSCMERYNTVRWRDRLYKVYRHG